jgi:L-alanine-DL-glutamate epimerase-like enolase superfamily enzyme
VIGALPPGAAVPEALRLVASGYTTLKVKVGGDPDADVARVAAVRTAVGAGVRLRLDANEGWALDQAERVLHRLAAFDIEYVEQPVARDDIDGMARLRHRAVVAIAADEALLESGGPDAVEAAGAADVWVLKPVLLGGPFRTLALARRAALLGVRCVVTTAVDGGVGRLCALHVAAVIAGHGWDGGLAHGLGTGGLLQNDEVETAEPERGRMPVTTLPGLGCADLGGTWTRLGEHVAQC